jgi:hypothetical protein
VIPGIWYFCPKVHYTVVNSKSVKWISIVFIIDPDTTFHFEADPDPDLDPSLSFYFYSQQCQFYHRHRCHNFKYYGQNIEIFRKSELKLPYTFG